MSVAATLPVTLDDKYILESGRVYLTGTQALVRLPMMQRQRDQAAGLNTAGYISGYRGSPLGGFDQALWQAKRFIKKSHIEFQPGTNEDLAATALWGTQQIHLYPGARYDGVFGIWYGKGPGVDRSGDVFKHANYAGTSKHGGVIALAGDDHMAKSSTTAHQSEPALIAALESGRLGGAALDVFAREPAVPEALRRMENVVLTPHLGGGSREGRREAQEQCVENVLRVLRGERPLAECIVVDPTGPG